MGNPGRQAIKDESGSPKDRPEHTDAMKDIDIRTIQPVVERRTPEKSSVTEKPTGSAFDKVLDAKMAQGSSAASIDKKVSAVNEKVTQTAEQIREIQRGLQRTLLEVQMRKDKSEA